MNEMKDRSNEEWKGNKQYKWSRVHYEAIGDCVAVLPNEEDREVLAEAFIKKLRGTNPLFDETRFRKACAVRIKDAGTWR